MKSLLLCRIRHGKRPDILLDFARSTGSVLGCSFTQRVGGFGGHGHRYPVWNGTYDYEYYLSLR